MAKSTITLSHKLTRPDRDSKTIFKIKFAYLDEKLKFHYSYLIRYYCELEFMSITSYRMGGFHHQIGYFKDNCSHALKLDLSTVF